MKKDKVKEVISSKEQAERRERLIAMGEMAAKIAHEIRNPLASMELFASILKKELGGDKKNLELIEHILSGIKTLDSVIANLLIFTKSPIIRCSRVDLSELLKEVIRFLKPLTMQQGIKYKINLNDLYCCWGDRELLKQVFLNLLQNAMQSMPRGGRLSLSVKNYREKPLEANEKGKYINKKMTDADLNGYVAIHISDTGTGISDKNKKRIFDPFFTTKDMGTGLGLTIANNIIAAHRGRIYVKDNEVKGVTFIIKLPVKGEEEM